MGCIGTNGWCSALEWIGRIKYPVFSSIHVMGEMEMGVREMYVHDAYHLRILVPRDTTKRLFSMQQSSFPSRS